MVSASKMRRAQQRVTSARPYAERLQGVIADLSSLQLDPDDVARFPMLQQREVKSTAIIVITPDKGLTGPLNSNILRRVNSLHSSRSGRAGEGDRGWARNRVSSWRAPSKR